MPKPKKPATSKPHSYHIEFLNQAQKIAWGAFGQHDVLFLIGPAGTAKTHLATAFAVSEVLAKKKEKIILTRPVVEAGESLGFLPGSVTEKLDPYMLPFYDSLDRCVGRSGPQRELIERSIEIAPLAYMRGRSLIDSELIVTPDGFCPIGKISVGDYVIGSNGQPTVVTGVFPQGVVSVYCVKFSDRTQSICSGDHLWSTMTLSERRHDKGFSVKTTFEIAERVKNKWGQKLHIVPVLSAPVEFSYQDVPIDPYLLGALLGDGHIRTSILRISSADIEIIQKCQSVSHTKFVPDIYKFNSPNIRLQLLQGLLDTDGSIVIDKRNGHCRIQFYSTSVQLAEDVKFLVRSLGGLASSRIRKFDSSDGRLYKGKKIRHIRPCAVVEIRMPINPFFLSRKANRFKPMSLTKQICSIEPAGESECTCISVDAPDSLYLTNDFIITHNTFHNAVCIFDEAQNATMMQLKLFLSRFGENSKVIVTGDPSQSDLPGEVALSHVVNRLDSVQGIGVITFKANSIVRHPLVSKILERLDP